MSETQIASYFARYAPASAKLGKAVRSKLRARLPGLSEIAYLYENQQAFVISYSPTERGADGVCGIALYPDSVKLFFGRGAQLAKADANKLLEGSGKLARYVVLGTIADYERPEIEALVAAALKLAKVRLDPRAKGAVISRAEAQKQRARRAKTKKAATKKR